MVIIVEESQAVSHGYVQCFGREGVCAAGFIEQEFESWVSTASEGDMRAVEAILIGGCSRRTGMTRLIKGRSRAAVIAVNEDRSLQDTLDLFAAGVDDVVRKPIHVRELLARIKAIRARSEGVDDAGAQFGRLRIYLDGRDPEVDGAVVRLPRRERRILELLARNRGRLVPKAQIFDTVYGLFDRDIDEAVVESHISKLRKRLRHRLAHDPIESQRFLGYRLVCR